MSTDGEANIAALRAHVVACADNWREFGLAQIDDGPEREGLVGGFSEAAFQDAVMELSAPWPATTTSTSLTLSH